MTGIVRLLREAMESGRRMTNRVHALTVILKPDFREDDVQAVIEAIQCFKGVSKVEKHISDPDVYFAQINARQELLQEIFQLLKGKYL